MPKNLHILTGVYAGQKIKDVLTEDVLRYHLFELKRSVEEIADHFGVCRNSVYNYIKRHNIEVVWRPNNEIIIHDTHAEILMINNLSTIVDLDDVDKVSPYLWFAYYKDIKYGRYVKMARKHSQKFFNKNQIQLHRFILGVNDPKVCVDHIDHNTLNNTKSNIRICTFQENLWNIGPKKTNKLGLKGITLTSSNRYCVRIQVDGKTMRLGNYIDLREAIEVFNEAAKKYHGEFACLNPVPDFQFLEGDY